MQRVRRSRMSVRDKAAIWDRWKRGESLSEIGRALDHIPGAVFHVLRARGHRSGAAMPLEFPAFSGHPDAAA